MFEISGIVASLSVFLPPIGVLALPALRRPASADAVLILAVAASGIVFLVPLRSSLRAAQDEVCPRELASLLLPSFAFLSQCFYWARYGYILEKTDVARFNAVAAVACLMYLACITRGTKRRRQARPLLLAAIVVMFLASFMISCAPVTEKTKGVIYALAAIGFGFCQVTVTLSQVIEVFRSRKVQGFSFHAVGWSLAASLLWAMYAALVDDLFYFVSSAINAVVLAAALAIVGSVLLGSNAGPDPEDQPLMPRRTTLIEWPTYSDGKGTPNSWSKASEEQNYRPLSPNFPALHHGQDPSGKGDIFRLKSAFGSYQVDELQTTGPTEEPELEPGLVEDRLPVQDRSRNEPPDRSYMLVM